MGNVQTQINKLFTDLAALGTGVIVGAATVAIIIGGLMWVFSAGSQRLIPRPKFTSISPCAATPLPSNCRRPTWS